MSDDPDPVEEKSACEVRFSSALVYSCLTNLFFCWNFPQHYIERQNSVIMFQRIVVSFLLEKKQLDIFCHNVTNPPLLLSF